MALVTKGIQFAKLQQIARLIRTCGLELLSRNTTFNCAEPFLEEAKVSVSVAATGDGPCDGG